MRDPNDTSVNLRAEALMHQARQQAGLTDFGGGDFRPGLTRFISGALQDAELNETGVALIEATVTRFLVNRLRFEADLRRHPEILKQPIEPPVVIMGLPRTGTTKLHRMIAVDGHFQSLRAWQIMNPAPLPEPLDPQGRDPRIAVAEQIDAMIDAAVPELLAGHPVRAGEVDEEMVTLMEMNFDHPLLAMRIESPQFEAWTNSRPLLPIYRYLRQFLQYFQWQTGRRGPYVLKSPLHLSGLDAIAEVFPSATLVHCHRDPAVAATSFMRLAEIARSLFYNRVYPHALGDRLLRLLSDMVNVNLKQRAELGARLRIVDVSFHDITHDPIAAIKKIYTAHGVALTQEATAAMQAQEASAGRTRPFVYSMEHYGKDQRDFDIAFEAYKRAFAAFL